MKWLKMHTEARNDAKLRSLGDPQHRVWFNLLCLAAEQDERGVISGYAPELLAVEVAGGDVGLLDETLKRLALLRIVFLDEDRIVFINFLKRQYGKPSDSPEKTRLRKQRQRENARSHAHVTPCHADTGVTKRDRRDMRDIEKKDLSKSADFGLLEDKKKALEEIFDGEKSLESQPITPGHADVTPMSHPVTKSHAIDTDTDIRIKHFNKAKTSIKKNSAPSGAELVEEDAPFGECGRREPTGDTPSLEGSIPDGSLPASDTPGMEPLAGSRHLGVYPEASVDSLFPASVFGDLAKGTTSSSQDALSSSKLPDQIAIEELSPCSPHSTTPQRSSTSKTPIIDLFQPSQPEGAPEADLAGSSTPTAPEEEATYNPSTGYTCRESDPADEGHASGTKPKPLFYLTKRKRKLSGWKLEAFDEFMAAFALKKGRAEAADAWLDIPDLTPELAARIIKAAGQEAKARPALIAKNLTPKWAQGWITGRRWEDWEEAMEEKHDKESQCGQDEEYQQSIREAVKRFL